LQDGVHVIRALCRDSLAARKLMTKIRELLYAQSGSVPPSLGRF
jgi:hypothetical protein